MKITVWGINYAPEPTGIAPYNRILCEYLCSLGHNVRIVTTFPYYPAWKKRPDDCLKMYHTDFINGVNVHRCWHFVPNQVTNLRRILHESSFVATSFLRLLFSKRPDLYIVVSPPLLLGLAIWILQFSRPAPYIFHVQDLQPDAAVGLGMLKPSLFTRVLYQMEAIAYRHAAAVSGISLGMLEAFSRKGVCASRQVYFPNGVRLPPPEYTPPPGGFRGRNGFTSDDFLAVYSGNLGVKQGLDILVDAATRLNGSRVRIVICGDGAARPSLEETIEKKNISNVILLPLQSEDDYHKMLVDADVCLVTQQAGAGAAFFPSKLLSILAHSRPVVGVADGSSELRRAIQDGNFGTCIPPGNPEELAETLLHLSSASDTLPELGRNGRRYVEQFSMEHVLADFERKLDRIVEGSR